MTRRRVLAWIGLGVLVVLAVAMFRTERRVEHDAAFCATSCHHKADDAAHASARGHAGVACQGCHTTTTAAAMKLWWQSVRKVESPDKHGKVDAKACSSCHEKRPAEMRLVAETPGHREHRGRKNVDCLSCHATDSHTTAAPEKACTKCHADERLHKSNVAGAETCLSCHGYTATPAKKAAPSTVACEKCHADQTKVAASAAGADVRPMKNVDEHVLHGGVACQLCHNAHGKKPKPPEGQPVCARCHQFEIFQAGTVPKTGPEGHRNCEGCHKPHAPKKTALQSCVNCHEKNAKGLFGAALAMTAKNGKTAALPIGAPAAKTSALKHESCASCHLPHSWKAERSGCMSCHEDKAKLLQTRSPPQHETCTSCHEVHGPPPTGAVCVSCHAKTKGKHVALAPERHKDCTTCHDPHAPKPEDTRTSCAKCHTTQLTQVMRDGPEGHTKNSCFGCHQPHDNPRPPANICASCHAVRAATVAGAGPPKHRVCLSCHETHKFKVVDAMATCGKCHDKLFSPKLLASVSGKLPHQGVCKSCHTVHGSPGVAQSACLGCHEKVATEFKPPNKEHGVCKSCHEPHRPASSAPARCGSCHQTKAAVAAKWPANSAHGQACNTCHQQHDVRNKKACADCHAQETASAMGGKHKCMQCHPPHEAPPGTGAAWWSRCNQCHAAKVESAKERGPTHAACNNCHKPHKFETPTCASCHMMAGKGLHDVAKHAASCNACHDPHVKSEPTRAQCLSCHTNRRDHEPNAQKCQACHMFR